MPITSTELKNLSESTGYSPGSNYAIREGETKVKAIDEFLGVIPFESTKLDPIRGLVNVLPAIGDKPFGQNFVPASNGSAGVGANWYDPNLGTNQIEDSYFTVSTPDADFETFLFRRIGSLFAYPQQGQQAYRVAAEQRLGPDARDIFQRLSKMTVLRELGRKIINGNVLNSTNTTNELCGLAGYYSQQGTNFSSDPQVWDSQATSPSPGSTLAEQVRTIIRTVSVGGWKNNGLGKGANALVMSRRARELLIQADTSSLNRYQPDPLNPSLYRYYFDGIPIYVAPVREDEASASAFDSTDQKTSIYALHIGGDCGVKVMFSGGDASDRGLTVEQVPVTGSTQEYTLSVHGYYTLFIPEHTAVSRLHNIDVSSVP